MNNVPDRRSVPDHIFAKTAPSPQSCSACASVPFRTMIEPAGAGSTVCSLICAGIGGGRWHGCAAKNAPPHDLSGVAPQFIRFPLSLSNAKRVADRPLAK